MCFETAHAKWIKKNIKTHQYHYHLFSKFVFIRRFSGFEAMSLHWQNDMTHSAAWLPCAKYTRKTIGRQKFKLVLRSFMLTQSILDHVSIYHMSNTAMCLPHSLNQIAAGQLTGSPSCSQNVLKAPALHDENRTRQHFTQAFAMFDHRTLLVGIAQALASFLV